MGEEWISQEGDSPRQEREMRLRSHQPAGLTHAWLLELRRSSSGPQRNDYLRMPRLRRQDPLTHREPAG